jgi:hypothetical protein
MQVGVTGVLACSVSFGRSRASRSPLLCRGLRSLSTYPADAFHDQAAANARKLFADDSPPPAAADAAAASAPSASAPPPPAVNATGNSTPAADATAPPPASNSATSPIEAAVEDVEERVNEVEGRSKPQTIAAAAIGGALLLAIVGGGEFFLSTVLFGRRQQGVSSWCSTSSHICTRLSSTHQLSGYWSNGCADPGTLARTAAGGVGEPQTRALHTCLKRAQT